MNTLAQAKTSTEPQSGLLVAPGETFGCTSREVAFARHAANGEQYMDAYVKAGYSATSNHVAKSHGSKVAARPRVRQLIDHLVKLNNTYSTVTVASLTAELEEARQLAIDCEQPAAVTSAIMAKAKLHGLDINRTQIEQRVSVSFDGAAEKLFEALGARAELMGGGGKVIDG